MRVRFQIPADLQSAWELLVARYRPYLPEIQMDVHSFGATPADALALLEQLREMSPARPKPERRRTLQLVWSV